MSIVTALELDTEASGYTGGEPVHFGGFPGVWAPGQPVAVSELGFESEEAALAAVAELELPLVEVEVEHGSAPMPARPNHASEPEQAEDEKSERFRRFGSHTEANARGLELGLTFEEKTPTLAEKTAQIEAAERGDAPDEPEGDA